MGLQISTRESAGVQSESGPVFRLIRLRGGAQVTVLVDPASWCSTNRPHTRLVASSMSAIKWQASPQSSSQRYGELSIISNSPKEDRRDRQTCGCGAF